jgi:hypothetical protein
VEGEIHPLDPCPAPRREGDSKGQMGSERRGLGLEPMGSNEETGSRPEIRQGVDTYPILSRGWIPVGTYNGMIHPDLVLGDVDIPSIQSEIP